MASSPVGWARGGGGGHITLSALQALKSESKLFYRDWIWYMRESLQLQAGQSHIVCVCFAFPTVLPPPLD